MQNIYVDQYVCFANLCQNVYNIYVNKCLILLHVDKDKSHVNMIILHNNFSYRIMPQFFLSVLYVDLSYTFTFGSSE